MDEKKNNVPEYTRRAVDNYIKKYDRIIVYFPKGTREKVAAACPGVAFSAVVRDVFLEWLKNHDTSGIKQTGTPHDTRPDGVCGSGSGSDDNTIENSDIYFE